MLLLLIILFRYNASPIIKIIKIALPTFEVTFKASILLLLFLVYMTSSNTLAFVSCGSKLSMSIFVFFYSLKVDILIWLFY